MPVKLDSTRLIQQTVSEYSLETPASSSSSEMWAGLIWAPLCAHGLLDRCVSCGEPDAARSEEYWTGQTQTRKSPDVSVERATKFNTFYSNILTDVEGQLLYK